MQGKLIVAIVFLISLAMVAASGIWVLEASGNWIYLAAASLLIALFSLFFNVSGAVYITEAERVDKGISEAKEGLGKVVVGVPTCSPELKTLRESIRSIKKMEYAGEMEIVVLDDTEDGEYTRRVREVCREEGVGLLHRKAPKGGKGGALNNLLQKTDGDFLAIFDYDEIVGNTLFLEEGMGHFRDGKVAFVQTNKECGGKGIFERAANYTNAAFVNLIQPINTKKGVALFTGSCGIFRTSALKDAGGFPDSVIEDVAVSLKLKWKGWKGKHIPRVYAVGGPVSSFQRFSEQHMRYIAGVTALLPEYARNIWKYPLEQQMIMLVHALGLHYVGLVQLAACAIAVLSAVHGVYWGQAASLAYLASTLLSLLFLSKVYVGSLRVGVVAYLLNYSIIVPRILATISSVFGKMRFGAPSAALASFLQLLLSIALFAVFWESGCLATAWWGLLFLSNPLLLLAKR
ncbi:glycosyltransferase [Candidatus Micrarchaeota archaeon]|nr:glycosyltransferase [Candidatus Micrarchaeota archaeon]MBD3417679.1 glycosyltransferase [Candidatus Micrarchaeota archaeon]